MSAATPPGTEDKSRKIKSKAKHFFSLYFLCYDNIYLTNWVLVLAEERLEFEAFGRGQRSDLGVGRQGHRGRL